MKILLTGGSGFIGKNLRESFLAEKYELYAPTRAELNCFEDESVSRFFSKHSFDVVIHSATKPGHRNAPDTSGLLYTNSRMIINLLKYNNSWGKFIDMGSGAIYDMKYDIPKVKEEYYGTHIPSDEHGYNKYIMAQVFAGMKNVVDFRIFGVYGRYEDYAIRFISNAICKALHGLPITLRQNRKFDYLFVDDLAAITDHFIMNDAPYKEYNITPDKAIEMLEIANIIKKVSGKNIDIHVANHSMGLEYSGDNTRLRTEMKNISLTPIEEGIGKLFEWYSTNMGAINKELLMADK